MILEYIGLTPGTLWVQWTVLEYEKMNGKQKIQFAPLFVGDGEICYALECAQSGMKIRAILLRLSANDAAQEKQFKNAKLDPHSFYALLHAVKEEIKPLKSIIMNPLQSKTFPQASKLPFAFNLPTPALTLLTVRV